MLTIHLELLIGTLCFVCSFGFKALPSFRLHFFEQSYPCPAQWHLGQLLFLTAVVLMTTRKDFSLLIITSSNLKLISESKFSVVLFYIGAVTPGQRGSHSKSMISSQKKAGSELEKSTWPEKPSPVFLKHSSFLLCWYPQYLFSKLFGLNFGVIFFGFVFSSCVWNWMSNSCDNFLHILTDIFIRWDTPIETPILEEFAGQWTGNSCIQGHRSY